MGVATKVIVGANFVEVETLGDMTLAEVLAAAEKTINIPPTDGRSGVFVDGKPAKGKQKIQPGQEVEVRVPAGQNG